MSLRLVRMASPDLNVIEALKIRLCKAISPDAILALSSTSISNLEAFITFLAPYDVSSCIQLSLKLDEKVGLGKLFSVMNMCWIESVRNLLKLIQPSRALKEFIHMYIGKFELVELLNLLKEVRVSIDPTHFYFLTSSIIDEASGVRKVSDFIDLLRAHPSIVSRIVADALRGFEDLSLTDIDAYAIERHAHQKYWDSLIVRAHGLKPQVKLVPCLRHLKVVTMIEGSVRRSLIAGEDPLKVLVGVPSRVATVVETCIHKAFELDIAFESLKYLYCFNELKYSPPSYDVVLNYMVVKEFESRFVSYITYLLINGFNKGYILDRLSRWWKVYELISK